MRPTAGRPSTASSQRRAPGGTGRTADRSHRATSVPPTNKESTLSGRTAVITGGARGIGLTLARALAAEGVAVALLDRLDTVDLAAQSVADEFNVPTYGQQVDVTDEAAVADAFKVVRKRLGVPRVLVTAAGIEINGESVKVTAEQWRKVIDVNLTGTFFSAQAFSDGVLNAGTSGSAVFIASMSGSIVNVPQWAASYNEAMAWIVEAVGRAVVGQQPFGGDCVGGVEGDRAAQDTDRGGCLLVG